MVTYLALAATAVVCLGRFSTIFPLDIANAALMRLSNVLLCAKFLRTESPATYIHTYIHTLKIFYPHTYNTYINRDTSELISTSIHT